MFKRTAFRYLSALVLALVLTSLFTTALATCPRPGACEVKPTIAMTIGNIVVLKKKGVPPRRPGVEHQSVLAVPVTITVKPALGTTTTSPFPAEICLNTDPGQCNGLGSDGYFPALTSGAPTVRTIEITAPSANAKTLSLYLCRSQLQSNCDGVYASADGTLPPIAATYAINIQAINISKIASPQTDTLYVVQWARPRGTPTAGCVAPQCQSGYIGGTPGFGIGNHTTFNYWPVSVGPFALVPGVDKDMDYGYAIVNFGADGYSDTERKNLESKIQGAVGANLNFFPNDKNTAENIMGALRTTAGWRGCDGPVAAGLEPIQNTGVGDTLANQTEASGAFTKTNTVPPEVHQGDGCGTSEYQVTWGVGRTSWKK